MQGGAEGGHGGQGVWVGLEPRGGRSYVGVGRNPSPTPRLWASLVRRRHGVQVTWPGQVRLAYSQGRKSSSAAVGSVGCSQRGRQRRGVASRVGWWS